MRGEYVRYRDSSKIMGIMIFDDQDEYIAWLQYLEGNAAIHVVSTLWWPGFSEIWAYDPTTIPESAYNDNSKWRLEGINSQSCIDRPEGGWTYRKPEDYKKNQFDNRKPTYEGNFRAIDSRALRWATGSLRNTVKQLFRFDPGPEE